MTTTPTDQLRLDVETDAVALETDEVSKPTIWRWIGQPVAVGLAVLGVGLYVAFGDFGATTARQLNWGAIGLRTWEHVQLTVVAALIVLVVALPLGVLLTRPGTRALAPPVVAFANGGQAIPAIGLLVLLGLWLRMGFWTAILALSVFGLLPVLRNTITGLRGVDPRTVEAGRGMGMSATAVLFRIELPLAVPVILAGVRVALILLVGTATLATFINGGGLGLFINTGIKLQQHGMLLVGAVLVSALALLIDWLGRVVEEVARPKGV